MRRFIVRLHVATAIAQVPFALALVELGRRCGIGAAASWVAALVMAGAVVAMLRGRIELASHDRHVSRVRTTLVEEPFYVHWGATVFGSILFLCALPICGVAAAAGVTWPGVGPIALATHGAALLIAAWSVGVRRRWVRVRQLEVAIAELPPAFEGMRIVQLSDLHIGALTPARRARRWVTRANGLGADLAVLTGDYVTSGVAFHDDIADVLGGLQAPLGVYAVPGNHDYFGDGTPLFDRLEARDVRVLRNEHVVIERNGASLVLAGIDDVWTRRADVEGTMDGVGSMRPVVVLAHDPKLFPALAARGADLVLSGHTHWGQVALPFLSRAVNLARAAYPLHAGEHRDGKATLVISPGLGTTGPPLRLGAPPEITVVRLRRG